MKSDSYDKSEMSLGSARDPDRVFIGAGVLLAETHRWFLQGKGIFTGARVHPTGNMRGNQVQKLCLSPKRIDGDVSTVSQEK